MMPTQNGSMRLFRLFGVNVFLHWSWFAVAVWRVQTNKHAYADSLTWSVAEVLALFAMVLMHEFGHSLSCRQVGGQADQIVLWPLGGVAYVSPPQRAGAQLWSIAAGPLVNVALLVVFTVCAIVTRTRAQALPDDFALFSHNVYRANLGLLIFNLLPIYPLDGGQILRSLLWFVMGRGRSLLVAAAIGMVGALVGVLFALRDQSIYEGVMAFFILSNCWGGWVYARGLLKVAAATRRPGVRCPQCRQAPPEGAWWPCVRCRKPFDPFAEAGLCPHCQARYAEVWCLDCSQWSPLEAWAITPPPLPGRPFPSARAVPHE